MPDGTVSIGGDTFTLPNIIVHEMIGKGANGVVFRGVNRVLERTVAVKIWTTLRANDYRDKVRQGLAEARKVSQVELPFVPRIFDAGEINGKIYVVMEYFDGVPLKDWLPTVTPCFGWRHVIAQKINGLHSTLSHKGIIHGDLHWGNILIHRDCRELMHYKPRDRYDNVHKLMYNTELDIRVIDFGTSYFSREGFSVLRHWKVYEELIDKLLFPIKMRRIWNHRKPGDLNNIRAMQNWFDEYLQWLFLIFLHVFESDECSGFRVSGEDELILTRDGNAYMRKLVADQQLTEADREHLMTSLTWPEYLQHKLIIL